MLTKLAKFVAISVVFIPTILLSGVYEAKQAGMSQERLDRIAPALSKYVTTGRIPGLITAVARKGKVVHFETQGFADVENLIPLKKDSLFRIYSMSKPITGVALMILIEEGKVRLFDPVSLYIPEFATTEVLIVNEDGSTSLEAIKKPLTIRDLATHTSGIAYSFTANKALRKIYADNKLSPYFFIDNLETSAKDGVIVVSSQKAFPNICSFSAALASKAPLMHQPGEKYTYSMGMDVLGCVIERASGQTFDVFLKDRIFKPLSMNDTFFNVPKSKAERFTNLYFFPGDIGRLIPGMANNLPSDTLMLLMDERTTSPYLDTATVFDGGSGLVSSTEDYLKFAQMLLNGGKLGDTRIISRKSVELFSRNHLGKQITDNPDYPEGMGFGITVGVTTDAGLRGQHVSDGTYFWGGAASTIFWVDPEEELVAVAMTQLMASPWPLRTEFTTLVYQAIDD
ncbi:MAG: serine hydrolase domain-containing protein [Gammaproteobacteria bacterium]